MNCQESKANDLFLLMFNLSQINSKEKIVNFFIDAVKDIWTDNQIIFTSSQPVNDNNFLQITVSGSNYGYLIIKNLTKFENEDQALLHNACGMLALILKKNEQEKLLADEKNHLQNLVEERTGYLQDEIEKRSKTEIKLSDSERELRLITDNMRDTVWLMDLSFRTTWISPSVIKTRGYTFDELVGMPLEHHLTPDSLNYMMQLVATEMTPEHLADPEADISVTAEFEYYCKDGSTMWADTIATVLRDSSGKPNSILGVGRDITERKRTESLLIKSEARLKFIQKSSGVGLWDWDMQTNLLEWSPELFLQFGLDPEKETATFDNWDKAMHPDDKEIAYSKLNDSIINHTQLNNEYRVIHPDGKELWINAIGNTFYDVDGKPIRNAGICIDITERKQVERIAQAAQVETKRLLEASDKSRRALLSLLEDEKNARNEIKKLNDELEQKVIYRTEQLNAANKELEAFAYSVSHDLRAPLRHVHGFSDLLNERIKAYNDEKSGHYIATIQDAAKKMGILIDDLLSFSRMGKEELQLNNVDANIIFETVIKDATGIRELAKAKGEELKKIVWVIEELPVVYGDKSMLAIVAENLVSNALKFSSKKESIEIKIGSLTFPKFETLEKSEEDIIYVQDKGAGFDMKYYNKLFGVFQRLHKQQDFAGNGIGLANVKRIITKHGGRVWAESTLGEGATFYFSLPKIHNS